MVIKYGKLNMPPIKTLYSDGSDIKIRYNIVVAINLVAVYSRKVSGNTLIINESTLNNILSLPETSAYLTSRKCDIIVDDSVSDNMIYIGYNDIEMSKTNFTVKYNEAYFTRSEWIAINLNE